MLRQHFDGSLELPDGTDAFAGLGIVVLPGGKDVERQAGANAVVGAEIDEQARTVQRSRRT